MKRLPLIISCFALAISLTMAGAYAKTQLIGTKQIKNNSLTTKDIRNSTVSSIDIGEGEVHPEDVTAPAPVAMSPPGAASPVSASFGLIANVGQITKTAPDSVVHVEWNGAVESGHGTNCVFQLRVNGAEPTGGGGEVFARGEAVNVATSGIYPGLPPATYNIEIWAKASASVEGPPSCIIGPSNPGIDTSIIAVEEIT